jgi:anti-sigma regulatory factor (Ser/Thr protein kinase)
MNASLWIEWPQAVKPVGVPAGQVEKLKTAVSEATMNAMEHGNQYNPELPVEVTVRVSPLSLSVRITDYGGEKKCPPHLRTLTLKQN